MVFNKFFQKKAKDLKDSIQKENIDTISFQDDIAQDNIIESDAQKEKFFHRLKLGLSKTRSNFSSSIDKIFSIGRKIDDAVLEELEELLISSDIGVETSIDIIETLSKQASKISDVSQLKKVLKEEIISRISYSDNSNIKIAKNTPYVIMVIGVNGVGKTTTIGKLAHKFIADGKTVMLAAADTFRAAAGEQLTIWAERSGGAALVRHKDNSDPASVAYDAVESAMAKGIDIVLIDTAGRLHTKVNLMEELKKIKRVVGNKLPEAPHEILMILDASTGQNAMNQVKMFHEAININSIALTKLDGTAKGGIAVGICSSMKVPLKFIGVGEKIDDLQEFNPVNFVDAIF